MPRSVALAVAILSVAHGAPIKLPKSVLAFEEEHDVYGDQASGEPLPAGLVFYQPSEIYLNGSMCAYAVEGATSDLPLGTDHYTLEMSIKPDIRRHSWFAGLIGWGIYSPNWDAHGFYSLSTNAFTMTGNSGLKSTWWRADQDATSALNFRDGEYHHVAASWDGHVRKLFVDGVEIGVEANTVGPTNLQSTENFCVGRTWHGAARYFKGYMKNIKIWKSTQQFPPSPPPPPHPLGAEVRRSITSLEPEDQGRFLSSIEKMMEGGLDAPFARFASMHGYPHINCVHGEPHFAHWHRIYLSKFEEALQDAHFELYGNRHIALHYWDWLTESASTRFWANDALQAQFDNLGEASRLRTMMPEPQQNCTPTGETCTRPEHEHVYQLYETGYTNPHSARPGWHWYSGFMTGIYLDDIRRGGMQHNIAANLLEFPHNVMHGALGYPMTTAAVSSWTLLFWMHHSQIDRLWETYLAARAEETKWGVWTGGTFTRGRETADVEMAIGNATSYNTPLYPFEKPGVGTRMNVRVRFQSDVGAWGGTCTCPDGEVYHVGEIAGSGCGQLACHGGVSGECSRTDNPQEGWGTRVTCDQPTPDNLRYYTAADTFGETDVDWGYKYDHLPTDPSDATSTTSRRSEMRSASTTTIEKILHFRSPRADGCTIHLGQKSFAVHVFSTKSGETWPSNDELMSQIPNEQTVYLDPLTNANFVGSFFHLGGRVHVDSVVDVDGKSHDPNLHPLALNMAVELTEEPSNLVLKALYQDQNGVEGPAMEVPIFWEATELCGSATAPARAIPDATWLTFSDVHEGLAGEWVNPSESMPSPSPLPSPLPE